MTSYVAHHVPFQVLVALESKMAASGVCQVFFALVLACLFDQVSAFDGGDAAALIIGLIFGIMAICACLGAYARRQQGVWRAISNRTHFEQREEVAFENLLWIFLLHIYGTPFLQLFSSDWALFFLWTLSLEPSVSTLMLGIASLVGSIHWTIQIMRGQTDVTFGQSRTR